MDMSGRKMLIPEPIGALLGIEATTEATTRMTREQRMPPVGNGDGGKRMAQTRSTADKRQKPRNAQAWAMPGPCGAPCASCGRVEDYCSEPPSRSGRTPAGPVLPRSKALSAVGQGRSNGLPQFELEKLFRCSIDRRPCDLHLPLPRPLLPRCRPSRGACHEARLLCANSVSGDLIVPPRPPTCKLSRISASAQIRSSSTKASLASRAGEPTLEVYPSLETVVEAVSVPCSQILTADSGQLPRPASHRIR